MADDAVRQTSEGVIVTERTIKLVATLLSMIVVIGGFAVAWGASQARLADAVTHREYDVDMLRLRQEQQAVFRGFDERIVLDSIRHEQDRDNIAAQQQAIQTLTTRLTQFICDQGSARSYCR
jgi:hypothetical protein